MPETSTGEVSTWLAERVAHYLGRPAQELDRTVPLHEYGLDSVCVFALTTDIEETLGVMFDPVEVWEHNSLDALTAYLTGRAAAVS